MIKTLRKLNKNLSAISYNGSIEKNPLYAIMLNNYIGRDYKELHGFIRTKKQDVLRLFSGEGWALDFHILNQFSTKYFYPYAIGKHLDGKISKSSSEFQLPIKVKKNKIFYANTPSIIFNNEIEISSFLLLKEVKETIPVENIVFSKKYNYNKY